MKPVVGILLITLGLAVGYLVLVGKLPTSGVTTTSGAIPGVQGETNPPSTAPPPNENPSSGTVPGGSQGSLTTGVGGASLRATKGKPF